MPQKKLGPKTKIRVRHLAPKAKVKKKGKSDSNMVMISPPNKQIAPKYAFIKFNSELDWFVAGNITTGVVTSVFGNNLNNPFASSLAISSVANTSLVTGSTAVASLVPSGFHQWIGSSATTGIYTNYLVYATKVECEVFPAAMTDTIHFGLAAFNNSKTSDVPASVADLEGKPYTKQVTMGAAKGQSKISMLVKWHNFWGLSKKAYSEAALVMNAANELQSPFGGSYGSAPVINGQIAMIVQSVDNVNIANPVAIRTKVTFYTKMYNPRRQTMAVT